MSSSAEVTSTIRTTVTVTTRLKMKLEMNHVCTASKWLSKSTCLMSKTSAGYTREHVCLLHVCKYALRGMVGKGERKIDKYTANTKAHL